MARGNYADRLLEDAVNHVRLNESEEQALSKYIHRENPLNGNEDFQQLVAFLHDFLAHNCYGYTGKE